MSRLRTLAIVTLPVMLAGGLLFGSAFGQPAPPPPPVPPVPPAPPAAVHVHHGHHGNNSPGLTVNIHDGKIEIDGIGDIKGMIDAQLQQALDKLDDPNIPPQIRDKLRKRLDKVRAKVDRKLENLDASDPEKLGEELGEMGEEISSEMDGFGEEMEAYGKEVEHKMEHDAKPPEAHDNQFHWDNNDDSDKDDQPETTPPEEGADESEVRDAVRGLGELALTDDQHKAISNIRAESDKQAAQARTELDHLSDVLQQRLADPKVSRDDVARTIDAIAAKEAAIRKARILAWVDARKVLDEAQRKKVESATARKKSK